MQIRRWLAALCGVCFCQSAEAGAWLQDAGRGQWITQATYYSTDTYYTRGGDRTAQPRFTKYELQPYLEYGLTQDITIGGSALLQSNQQSDTRNSGLADPEFFARSLLWRDDHQVISIQPLIKLPSRFSSEDPPRGGTRSTDAELSLLYGRNLNWLTPRDYLDVRVGYRYRGNALNDQIRADAVLGLEVAPGFQVIPGIRSVNATRLSRVAAFSENGDQDYDLLRVELTGLYHVTPIHDVSLTFFDHVKGRQTGNGTGLTLGITERF